MFQHRGALEHLLSPADYGDPEHHRREMQAVFARGWHYLAPAAHLARPGQYVARDVLGIPVVVRHDEGRLRAFRNVCAHRHSLVVRPGRGQAETLRCQYHNWEYGRDGQVCRVPDGRSFRGFRAEGLGLQEFAVERLGGMVFVHLGEDPEPLRASLGDFADEIERFFGQHRLVWEWTTEHPVDWKVIAENAVESYHVPATHPGSFQDFRPEEMHDHRIEKRYTRYRDLKPWGDRWVERALLLFARLLLPQNELHRFSQAHVFPSFLLYYGELFSTFIALEPLGPRHTRHVQLGFVPRDLSRPWLSRPLQELFTRIFTRGVRRVMREDMRMWADVQHGLDHSSHPGILGAREERVFAFQGWLCESLRVERTPTGKAMPADGLGPPSHAVAAELDVSVVVPVYQNADTLEELCRRLIDVLDKQGVSFEILCIDDGSRDDSWAVLQHIHGSDPRVCPIRLARNFGQAAALCAGLDRIRGEIAITIDADLQNLPEDVPALLAEMKNGHGLVSGYRNQRADPRLARLIPSWVFNRMVQAIIGQRLRDYGCGLNALSRELALELCGYGEMRRFLKPLAASLARSVGEVSVRHAPSPSGRSSYTFMSLVGVQLDFFTSFSRKPFQLIGIAGIGLFGIGFLGGLMTLALYFGPGVSVGGRIHTLVVLSTIVGLQFAVLGLLGEFTVRIYRSQNQPFYVVRDEPS